MFVILEKFQISVPLSFDSGPCYFLHSVEEKFSSNIKLFDHSFTYKKAGTLNDNQRLLFIDL